MARQHYGGAYNILKAVFPNIANVGYGLGNVAYHGVLSMGSGIKALGKIALGAGEGILGTAPEIKNSVNFGIDGVSNLINGNFCNSGESAFKAVEHVFKAGASIASTGANTMHEIAADLSSMGNEVYSVGSNFVDIGSNIVNGISEVISYASQASAELSSTYDSIGSYDGFDIIGEVANSDWVLVQ